MDGFHGRPFKIEPKQIFPFAVVNSYAKNFSTLKKKWIKKFKMEQLELSLNLFLILKMQKIIRII